jgi:hypothetical protein
VDDKHILFSDPLSYGGREVLYSPLYHILMAFLSFGNIALLKLWSELFICMAIFLVYKIAKELSGSTYASLFSASLAAFYPIIFNQTLNTLSIYSLIAPLILLNLYSLLKLDELVFSWLFVASAFLLALLHPSSLILVLAMLFYLVLLAGGALTPTKLKKEAIVFYMLVVFLFQFIFYKKAFLQYGFNLLWYNVPANILADNFRGLSLLDLVVGIGFIPLIFGIIGIYFALINIKNKISYLFASFGLAVLILIFFRFLTLYLGLMFLGLVLCIFSSITIANLIEYFHKIKFEFVNKTLTILFIIIFLIGSFYPSYNYANENNKVFAYKVRELRWFAFNTPVNITVLGNVDEGNLITTISKRKNVVDSNFLLAPDPLKRTEDVQTIYTTSSEAIAMELIRKYNISAIYLSDDTMDAYNIRKLAYADKNRCFTPIRGNKYYVVKC